MRGMLLASLMLIAGCGSAATSSSSAQSASPAAKTTPTPTPVPTPSPTMIVQVLDLTITGAITAHWVGTVDSAQCNTNQGPAEAPFADSSADITNRIAPDQSLTIHLLLGNQPSDPANIPTNTQGFLRNNVNPTVEQRATVISYPGGTPIGDAFRPGKGTFSEDKAGRATAQRSGHITGDLVRDSSGESIHIDGIWECGPHHAPTGA